MIKRLKTICNWLLAAFMAMVVYLLLAAWQDWPFNMAGIWAFLLLLAAALLLAAVVAGAEVCSRVRRQGWRAFAMDFAKRFVFFAILLALAALWRKNFDWRMVLGAAFCMSFLNYYYSPPQENK